MKRFLLPGLIVATLPHCHTATPQRNTVRSKALSLGDWPARLRV